MGRRGAARPRKRGPGRAHRRRKRSKTPSHHQLCADAAALILPRRDASGGIACSCPWRPPCLSPGMASWAHPSFLLSPSRGGKRPAPWSRHRTIIGRRCRRAGGARAAPTAGAWRALCRDAPRVARPPGDRRHPRARRPCSGCPPRRPLARRRRVRSGRTHGPLGLEDFLPRTLRPGYYDLLGTVRWGTGAAVSTAGGAGVVRIRRPSPALRQGRVGPRDPMGLQSAICAAPVPS